MPFRDVIGHRRLVSLLSRAVSRGTLPPSLIFAGPAGVGKRRVAMAVAEALNCLSPVTDPHSFLAIDACGTCPSCTRIGRGVHPDVIVVEPGESGSIKIEQVRDVIDQAAYRPFEGRRRVVVIDEADALVTQGQNALLKTLEEPPPSSVFVLVTARPDVLLPTVRSRCPKLPFRPLGAAEIAEALVRLGHKEKEAHAIAATADGSIGRALEASAGELVDARDVAERVLAQLARGGDARHRIDGGKELLAKTGGGGATDRDQLATHLRAMASMIRDMELLAIEPSTSAIANLDLQASLQRMAPSYAGDRGLHAFTIVDQAIVALDRNASAKIVADWVVVNL